MADKRLFGPSESLSTFIPGISDRTLVLNLMEEINRLTDEVDAMEVRLKELERQHLGSEEIEET